MKPRLCKYCEQPAVWAWRTVTGTEDMLCDDHAAQCDLADLEEL